MVGWRETLAAGIVHQHHRLQELGDEGGGRRARQFARAAMTVAPMVTAATMAQTAASSTLSTSNFGGRRTHLEPAGPGRPSGVIRRLRGDPTGPRAVLLDFYGTLACDSTRAS